MNTTLSVVSISFNNLEELKETCRSVDEQAVLPAEHLIIDGSTGNDILNWLTGTPQPGYRRWIHERDNGISDAFNKGIAHARGTVIHLLNSGDRYVDKNALATVEACFEQDPTLMWVHAQYVQHRGGTDVTSGLPFESSMLWKGMRTVAHPTMFIKKEVYERRGVYDRSYKIAMDYDMLVRIREEKFRFIPQALVYFAPGGASHHQFSKGLSEVKRSYKNHLGTNPRLTLWQWRQRLLRGFMRTWPGKMWFRWKNRKKIVPS